jgi:plasmid stabilization system protein ParE
MAKRIVWTIDARNDRREIMEYWFNRTGSKNYSRKLAHQFREATRYISQHNYLGRATNLENVRVTVIGHYLLFYRLSENLLEVISLFDSRQNPAKLNLE